MRGLGGRKRVPNWLVGLVLIVVIAVASLLAYTKTLPWSHQYTIKAVFSTAQTIAPNSPVRIAGVNVGKVTGVENLVAPPSQMASAGGQGSSSNAPPGRQAAVVAMEINDEGLPIHDDATFSLRPRLFLEGNLFVDLHPGSPNAPVAEDGHVFGMGQTSVSVQLDQVFSTLQTDVRSNLKALLHSLGDAFIKYGGAKGLNTLYRTSGGAFKDTSLVNEALLGTEPHDLSGFVRNLDSTVRALDANRSDLRGLITNFRIVTGALAAHDRDLARAVSLIPGTLDAARPAFAALNGAFPAVRAFAREALPGVRSTPAALTASMPLLRQLNGLLSKRELRGLTHDLRPAIPDLTKLTLRSIPLLDQSRSLSSCANQVLIPFFQSTLPDPDPDAVNNQLTNSKVYPQMAYAAEGFGGISRSGDANGQPSWVLASSGPNIVSVPGGEGGNTLVGTTFAPILGARPAISSSLKTPFRPGVPCEKQQPPNLDSGAAGPPVPQTTAPGGLPLPLASLQKAGMKYLTDLGLASKLLGKKRLAHAEAGTATPTGKAAALIKAAQDTWRTARRAFLAGKVAKTSTTKSTGGTGSGG
jgi:phospholipid/cholesterol/gamma-HCH transport system substrate-binding protein